MIDIFKVLAVIVVVIVLLIPKKKDYEYNALDEKGVIFNIVLSAIYVPLSLAGVLIFNYLNEKSGTIYPSWFVHMFANFAINTVGFMLFGIIPNV